MYFLHISWMHSHSLKENGLTFFGSRERFFTMYFCPPQTHPVPGMCLCEVWMCHGCMLQAKRDMNDLSGWSELKEEMKNYIPSFVVPTCFPRTSKHLSDVPPLSLILFLQKRLRNFSACPGSAYKASSLDLIVYLVFLPWNEYDLIQSAWGICTISHTFCASSESVTGSGLSWCKISGWFKMSCTGNVNECDNILKGKTDLRLELWCAVRGMTQELWARCGNAMLFQD